MRNETWLEELACELRAAGIAPAELAGVIVELQGHLDDSAQSALTSFGTPRAYAAQVIAAIGPGPRPPAGPVRVKAHRIAKSYRRKCVLRDVDLEVRAGDVTALIGPNGCGLDLDSTQRFWELLWDRGEHGAAALVVSHTTDALSRAARVVELPMAVPSWA